ncbi:Gfo/Idh/MocA family oxidoreductase [Rubripirellula sp.]|nr:Gfo/Idh/MocA family oxidoreductase [Rubripirellula sp.]MDB4338707.1 Gfo/Idh/MocA family oxidoreductase [Rubripirellula sp.]
MFRMGLIGGGGNGFIGRVHVTAATLDREAVLCAGAFSSDAERSRAAAKEFLVANDRAYGSYLEMLGREAQLPEEERIDFVSIATPNHTHAEIAKSALRAGFNVVCDKPMTTLLTDADDLVNEVHRSGKVFAVSHNYSGYPMVRQAREMMLNGDLGELLAVRVSYQQGWMHGMQPDETPERGAWKSDPSKNGRAGSLGDVGTHAFHLMRFITNARPTSLICQMQSYSAHHDLDDYGQALIQLEGNSSGSVTWSQVSHGRLNDLTIEVDGSKAALSWSQETPNQLLVRQLGKPLMTYDRNPGASYTTPAAREACRLPPGHPEAFFEAFANVYRDVFSAMRQSKGCKTESQRDPLFPTVEDGRDGVLFTQRCLESHDNDSEWVAW